MKLTGNTIFITGGGSGIGRGIAESFHKLGNKVIIGGRRKGHLDAVTSANPGMESVVFDVSDPEAIKATAANLVKNFPELNVLFNNAGIMNPDQVAGAVDEQLLTSTIETNLYGPIRLTSALIDQIKSKKGTIIYNTSVLAFVPLAVTSIYSATKAALHSYLLSQRFVLRGTGVSVLEIAPPWVGTELMNSDRFEQAMPLDKFIAETMQILGTDTNEVVVDIAKPFRANPGPAEETFITEVNELMLKVFGGAAR